MPCANRRRAASFAREGCMPSTPKPSITGAVAMLSGRHCSVEQAAITDSARTTVDKRRTMALVRMERRAGGKRIETSSEMAGLLKSYVTRTRS